MVEIEIVALKVFQKFLLSKHLAELFQTVAKKLSQ